MIRLNDAYVKPFINDEEMNSICDEVLAAQKSLLEKDGKGNDFCLHFEKLYECNKQVYRRAPRPKVSL